MWNRFVRAIKSFFGGAVSAMENPKLILEQNIRELNDQVPKMNENIATVKANVMLLKKELSKYEKRLEDLTSKIQSAIKADRDDIAEKYALQLQKAEEDIVHTNDQLKFAEDAFQKALQVKKMFMREKDRKIQEAREALRASERAEWQGKVADAMERFEVNGLDSTHDEMLNRINEETAKNEARMELALGNVDTDELEIELNADQLRASEIVKKMKAKMSGKEEEKEETPSNLKSKEEAPKAEKPEKTVGRKSKSKN